MKRLACLLVLFAFLAATATQSVLAQPAQDAITETARQRYREGVALFDAGKYEEARAAFLQSYALKPHPVTLLNLGISEVRSSHPVAGGNHLQQFLREAPDAKPEDRTSALQGIEDAKRRSAQIVVTVDAAGADVSIDGTLVGKSPLPDPIFVEPGARTVLATLGTQNAMARVDAKRGAAAAASIVLGGSQGTSPRRPEPGDNRTPPPLLPVPPVPPPGGPPPEVPGPSESGREPFFDWFGRKPLAWVGTALTGAGLGFGIGFSVAAANSAEQVDADAAAIRAEATKRDIRTPCSSDGSNDARGFAVACGVLRDDIAAHDANVAITAVSWTVFGAALIGTVTYVMVDWFPEKSPPATGFVVVPAMGPGVAGVTIGGNF